MLPNERTHSDELSSQCGIDYTKLCDLLAGEQWKEADLETKNVIVQAVGREEGKLIVEDIEKLPCPDLRTIDTLWVKYSNNRFGFSVQKRIWQSLGGSLDAPRNTDYETWQRFGEKVGWRISDSWLFWDQLSFTLNADVGHLPALSNGRWSRSWWGVNYHLILRRLEACGF